MSSIIDAAVLSAVMLVLLRPGPSDSLAELTCFRHRARTRLLLGKLGGWPVPVILAEERKALWS